MNSSVGQVVSSEMTYEEFQANHQIHLRMLGGGAGVDTG